MGLLSKIKSKFSYNISHPLVYDEGLRKAYSTSSVCGGLLKGKNVVVTGATSGIGFSIAQRFLDEGCNVIITGRNSKKLNEAVSLLRVADKSDLKSVIIDQLDIESVLNSINQIFENSNIDIWINCAGVFKDFDRKRVFRGVDRDSYFEVVNTNLKSNIVMIDNVANAMITKGINGKIINIASICGFTNHFGYTPYGISKNGLIEFTRQKSQQFNDNVSIIAVAPGSVATRMGSTGYGKNIAGGNSFTKHTAIPEEIAAVVAFLSGPIGNKLSGQTILASAGERV